ncbi:C2H2-type domain-containing protein [Abeliophyllum distichum]|uniref:C2H2-type domain-containing protein n=1 Tax=Abeliophyllum distichum TaxID=126358 RepID=A0ABD1NUL8_9LAMI
MSGVIFKNLSSTVSPSPRPNLIPSANVVPPYQSQVPNLNPCLRPSVNITQPHSGVKRKTTDSSLPPVHNTNITNNYVRNLTCVVCQVSCSNAFNLKEHVKSRSHKAKLKWMQLELTMFFY